VIAKCLKVPYIKLNPLNAELNPICHSLALLGAHHILHDSRIRVKHASAIVVAVICSYVGRFIYYLASINAKGLFTLS